MCVCVFVLSLSCHSGLHHLYHLLCREWYSPVCMLWVCGSALSGACLVESGPGGMLTHRASACHGSTCRHTHTHGATSSHTLGLSWLLHTRLVIKLLLIYWVTSTNPSLAFLWQPYLLGQQSTSFFPLFLCIFFNSVWMRPGGKKILQPSFLKTHKSQHQKKNQGRSK